MKTHRTLFQIAGLTVTATGQTFVIFVVLAVVLSVVGLMLSLPLVQALIFGVVAAFLHYLLDFLHHIGHSIAARSTGYPMSGVFFWGIFGASVYPRDEGELPAAIHIRRALGGPIMSAIISVILLVLLLTVGRASGGLVAALLGFAFLANLLLYTLGALGPGFGLLETDFETIRKWRGKA